MEPAAEAVETPQLRQLGNGEILDISLKLAANNAATLGKIVLFVVAPAQILVNFITVSANPDATPGPFGGGGAEGGDTGTFFAAFILTTVISFLAGQLATAASFKAIADAYLGHAPTWRDSLRYAGARFHSVVWIVILGGLFTALGTLLFIIPGIYLAFAFTVAVPVLLSEGTRGRHALRRSRELVRGRWWKVFLLVMGGTILAGIVAGAIELLIASVLLVGSDNRLVVFLVGTIAGIAGALIATPYKAAFTTVLYIDLRVRKEAFDLQLLAQSIGVEPRSPAA